MRIVSILIVISLNHKYGRKDLFAFPHTCKKYGDFAIFCAIIF